jgi:serine/threonine protein kinase
LALEYCTGGTLDGRLADMPLPPAEAAALAVQVAQAVAAAHALGLIHCDVKPSTVWLAGPRQQVKLLDLGMARAVADDTHLTQSGTVAGRPAYTAPEQARGETGALTHRPHSAAAALSLADRRHHHALAAGRTAPASSGPPAARRGRPMPCRAWNAPRTSARPRAS